MVITYLSLSIYDATVRSIIIDESCLDDEITDFFNENDVEDLPKCLPEYCNILERIEKLKASYMEKHKQLQRLIYGYDEKYKAPFVVKVNNMTYIKAIEKEKQQLQPTLASLMLHASVYATRDASGCSVPDASGCSVSDDSDCSVSDALGCSVPVASDYSVPVASGCSVPDASGCSVPGASDYSDPDASDCSVPDASDYSVLDASDYSVSNASNYSVSYALLCSSLYASSYSAPDESGCSVITVSIDLAFSIGNCSGTESSYKSKLINVYGNQQCVVFYDTGIGDFDFITCRYNVISCYDGHQAAKELNDSNKLGGVNRRMAKSQYGFNLLKRQLIISNSSSISGDCLRQITFISFVMEELFELKIY